MIYKYKHNKFIESGYLIAHSLKAKIDIINNKYQISKKSNILKEDVVGVSQIIYQDLNNIAQSIKSQYKKTKLPKYISYGMETMSELKSDIHLNPFDKETEEQTRKIDKKKFFC